MKPRFFVVIALFFLFFRAPAIADAQPQAQRPLRYDEEVVVTADREPENVRDVGSAVSLISSDQIAASGARWLIDVLQFAPGVSVVRNGPAGALTEVFLRGSSTGHTLFLVDGVKVNSPSAGGYDLAGLQISADQIDRIEIVRGPQSTLYGSQAIGGVINVITRRGEGSGSWGIEADGGSFSSRRLHSWVNGATGGFRYAGSASYYDAAGFSAADRGANNLERDGYRNLSYHGRFDYAADNGAQVRAFVRGFDGEADFDGFGFAEGPIDAARNVQDTRETYAGVGLAHGTASFTTDVELSVSDAALETATPDDFFTGFFLDSAIYELDWQNDVALPAGHELIAGLEFRREQATISSESTFGTDGFDEHVDFVGIYLQDRLPIGGRAHVAAGFRYEDHSTFGSKWTGRLTASIDATRALRVHASVGSAFKAPTLNDLYFPGFSNPDLRPEESIGFDAGLEMATARARLDVTYFRNDITDLIQFDFVAGIPGNLGEVLAQGVEAVAAIALSPALDVAGNYTFTSARPRDSDEQLIRRPRHQGGVRLTWRHPGGLRTWGEVRFKEERFDAAPGGRVAMAPYAIFNLAADYPLSSVVGLRGRVENLFDTDYEEVFGFATAGLSAYAGVTVTLTAGR